MNNFSTPPSVPRMAYPWSHSAARRFALRTTGKVLSADSMLAEARLATGLFDFGEESFQQALEALLRSCANDARLSPFGLRALRRHCIDSLITRLRIQDYCNKHPEISEVRVDRPLFVLGLPCCGAAPALHLLSQDRSSRSFRFWELLCPAPSPAVENRNDPRIRVARQWMEDYRESIPVENVHCPPGAEEPAECHTLFQHDFTTLNFTTRYCLTEYPRWLAGVDMRGAYRHYKTILQVLLWKRGGAPIVLRDPFHLWNLDALLETFPDARIVQLHRDPAEIVPIWSRMCVDARRTYSDHVDPDQACEEWGERFAEGLDRMMKVRDTAARASFLDIASDRLDRDPIGTVRLIYAHFGFTLHEDFAERMRVRLAVHPRDYFLGGRGDLDRFAWKSSHPAQRFAGYRDRFGAVLGN